MTEQFDHFGETVWANLNRLDAATIHFIGSFAHRSWIFDNFVQLIGDSNLCKGGACIALFAFAWFRGCDSPDEKREILMFGFISSAVALLVGRALSLAIPFRERPFNNPAIHFQFPFGTSENPISWNSMPSDHAVLFFCLATSLWFVSRRLGLLAYGQAVFIVCLPRIYFGYHYPSDVIAGALLGSAVACTAKIAPVRKWATRPGFRLLEFNQSLFYAISVAWLFEVSELFETLLATEQFVRHAARHLL